MIIIVAENLNVMNSFIRNGGLGQLTFHSSYSLINYAESDFLFFRVANKRSL